MDRITLNNGVQMPLVGLGTWDLRGEECVQTVAAAIQMGYRLIDTAQMYDNETEVGKGVLKSGMDRHALFITTKLYRISSSYEAAKKAIEVSLKRLGTDYVDLLLLHEPYRQGPEMYRALEEALKAGKARAIGISNYDEGRYAAFLRQCRIVPAVNQLECHVYYQKWAFQENMQRHGTQLQAWAPLSSGIKNVAGAPALQEIGKHYGKSAAQVALRFLVQRGISVIPKSKRESRLRENMDIFDFSLSAAEVQTICGLDQNDTLFPWTKMF